MTLYLARKDGQQFYIQPEQIEAYAALGYEIYKMEPQVVSDVASEAATIAEAEQNSTSVEITKEENNAE